MKRKRHLILNTYFFILMGFLSSNVYAQAPNLVIVKQGTLMAESQCRGPKKTQITIAIPQDTPQAYSHTDVREISRNGNRSYSVNYDKNNQQVSILAMADSHNECGCFGFLCNKPGSNIAIEYTVYAQKNACPPEPSMPSEDSVNVHDYQIALDQLNRSKICNKAVLELKKKDLIQQFKSTIVGKITNKHNERKVLQAEELAKVQVFKKKIEDVHKEIIEIYPLLANLARSLAEIRAEFNSGFNVSYVNSAIEWAKFQIQAEQEKKKNAEDFLDQYPELKKFIESKRKFIHPQDRTVNIPFGNLMDTFLWMERLKNKVGNFDSLHRSISYRIQKLQDQVDNIKRDSPIQIEHSLPEALGLTEIVGVLSQYRSKADEFHKKALDNKSSLERIHRLNADTIRDILCEIDGGNAYCRKIKVLQPSESKFNPFPNGQSPFPKPFPQIPINLNRSHFSAIRPFGETICLTLEFYVDYYSNMVPVPNRDGIKFASVNDKPIAFKIDENSLESVNGRVVRSKLHGCFPVHFLKMRSNSIYLNYTYGSGEYIPGSSGAILYANFGKSNQQTICHETRTGGTQGRRQCQGQMILDLKELDEGVHQRISDLQRKTRDLEIEILRETEELNELKTKLNYYSALDLGKIVPEELSQISSDLNEIAIMLDDLKFRAEIDKQQVYAEITEILKNSNEKSLDEILLRNYDLNNDEILGPVVLPDLIFTEAIVNAYKLGGTKNDSSVDLASAYQKVYKDITQEIQKSIDSNDFKRADAVFQSWKFTKVEMLKRLQERKAGAKELDLYRKTVVDIDAFIAKYFDSNGFFLAAKIPEDIKSFISSAEKGNKFAEQLRIALNKNREDYLNAEQKAVRINYYMMIRAYNDLFTFSTVNDKSNLSPNARKEVEHGLVAMAEAGFRIGASFTPVGKFVDFCELVTGRSLCKPSGEELSPYERSLSGLGIFLGSGALVRSIAKSEFIRNSNMISDLMMGFYRIIENNKGFFKADGENLSDVGRRFIRLFNRQVNKETAQEIVARSEKVMLETLRDFKRFSFVDPAEQNRILKEVRKYRLPAWDVRYGVMNGVLSREKTFVRFFPKLGNSVGGWIVPDSVVIGLTPLQIKEILAVAEVPTHFVKVVVPAGTEIFMGRIAPNAFGGVGESVQYFMPKFEPSYFREISTLTDIFRGF